MLKQLVNWRIILPKNWPRLFKEGDRKRSLFCVLENESTEKEGKNKEK